MTSEEEGLRRDLVDVAARLYERGHNAPLDGNISVRLGANALLCTPSGAHKGRLNPEDLVHVAFDAGDAWVVGKGRPSGELALHLALLRGDPGIGAVVHSHSPYATALTVAGVSLDEPVVPEAILALGKLPTVPYASPTTGDVPDAVQRARDGAPVFLLARHGPVAVGKSLEEAFTRIELVEHTAKITLLARAAGGTSPLAPDEVARLRQLGGHARST